MGKIIKIANGQGFWGDSVDAPLELINNADINYLTLDYLAEVTMAIMQKQYNKSTDRGYANDFVDFIDQSMDIIISKNIKIITNAGGVNPYQCSLKLKEILNILIKFKCYKH